VVVVALEAILAMVALVEVFILIAGLMVLAAAEAAVETAILLIYLVVHTTPQ